MLRPGISRTGGKSNLVKRLVKKTPHHKFFLSLFCGAGWYEINKPRVSYEVFNDKDAKIINYLRVISRHPKKFDDIKQTYLGLLSEKTFYDIKNGNLKPKDEIEKAFFYYYQNKVGFAGVNRSFGGINPQTTRPYTNNDGGLLSPIDPAVIKRLQYVIMLNRDFRSVYELFENHFHKKKGLGDEGFIFADPPYPGAEFCYTEKFTKDDHYDLINLLQNTPFKFMLTVGGDCEFYVDELDEFVVEPIGVQYRTSSNHQYERQEYIIRNYKHASFIGEQNTGDFLDV